jgi:hypothetical protein
MGTREARYLVIDPRHSETHPAARGDDRSLAIQAAAALGGYVIDTETGQRLPYEPDGGGWVWAHGDA